MKQAILMVIGLFLSTSFSAHAMIDSQADQDVDQFLGLMNMMYSDLDVRIVEATAGSEQILNELYLLDDALSQGINDRHLKFEFVDCKKPACTGERF